MTIRNLPPEVHRALKARARRHGRSTEAEVRLILSAAVDDPAAGGLGTQLVAAARELGAAGLDVERDRTPYVPVDLS